MISVLYFLLASAAAAAPLQTSFQELKTSVAKTQAQTSALVKSDLDAGIARANEIAAAIEGLKTRVIALAAAAAQKEDIGKSLKALASDTSDLGDSASLLTDELVALYRRAERNGDLEATAKALRTAAMKMVLAAREYHLESLKGYEAFAKAGHKKGAYSLKKRSGALADSAYEGEIIADLIYGKVRIPKPRPKRRI